MPPGGSSRRSSTRSRTTPRWIVRDARLRSAALVGYLLYGFGYIVPLLRRDLGLSESIAGLHASAIAVGIILSGAIGERFVRRLGAGVAARVAVLGAGAAGLAVAAAPHPAISLLGGLSFGFCAGSVLSWVNQVLSALGGHVASVALARANLSALVASLLAPLAVAALDTTGAGGWLGLLVPLPLIGLIEVVNWRSPIGDPPAPDARAARNPLTDQLRAPLPVDADPILMLIRGDAEAEGYARS